MGKRDALKSLISLEQCLASKVRTESYETPENYVWSEALGWSHGHEQLPAYFSLLYDSLNILINIQNGSATTLSHDIQSYLRACELETNVIYLDDIVCETLIVIGRLNIAEKSPFSNVSTNILPNISQLSNGKFMQAAASRIEIQ